MKLRPVLLALCVIYTGSTSASGDDNDQHVRNVHACPPGYFFSHVDQECRQCSSACPEGHVPFRMCSKYHDLGCRLEYRPSDEANKRLQMGASEPHGKNLDHEYEEYSDNLELTLEKQEWHHWKTLAFALIALLTVLIVLATVIVVVACIKLRHALVVKQQELTEIDDADSGYVVIHTLRGGPDSFYHPDHYTAEDMSAHPPLLLSSRDTALGESTDGGGDPSFSSTPSPAGRQSLCFLSRSRSYTPQRRLLTYDADDVFESDDQSRCATSVAMVAGTSCTGGRVVNSGSITSIPTTATGDQGGSTQQSPSQRKKKSWFSRLFKRFGDKAARSEKEKDSEMGVDGCFGPQQNVSINDKRGENV